MSNRSDQSVQAAQLRNKKCGGVLNVVYCIYNWNVLSAHQQTISSENVVNITSQLQNILLQSTEVVDQSASNLNVVTTVITQIANISSPNAQIDNNVSGISLSTTLVTKQFHLRQSQISFQF